MATGKEKEIQAAKKIYCNRGKKRSFFHLGELVRMLRVLGYCVVFVINLLMHVTWTQHTRFQSQETLLMFSIALHA